MDNNDKHDGRAEIRLQLSDATQELTQPTESDTNQVRLVSTNRELSADINFLHTVLMATESDKT